MKENLRRTFNAHYNLITKRFQSNYAHNSETASIAIKKNPLPFLENLIWLICKFHDCGKYAVNWQDYFEEVLSSPDNYSGPKEDHTTAGGQLIEELAPGTLLSQIVQTVIYGHHGLQDCVSLEDGLSLYIKRREKAQKLSLEQCKAQFFVENDRSEIERRCEAAKEESAVLIRTVTDTMKSWDKPQTYGNRDFFLGMYVRFLQSILIDADRRNTEDFMSEAGDIARDYSDDELLHIWKTCRINVERKIAGLTDKSGINTYRSEISEMCRAAAAQSRNLYQLTVPTGAGKTLSSLRFAVNHAELFHKKRIIYVAPFNSIVEQNAEEIKKAIDMPDIVLEHHCNIVMEKDTEQARYDRITEDWASPVIVTSAVQFLDTLFAGATGNVRRMHSLCNSVIIMDEVQALPVNVLELFNLAMNFLTEFMDTTVVLCTATQPLLDRLPKNRLRPPVPMVERSEKYREVLRRTEIVDCTGLKPGGMDIEAAAEFIFEKAQRYRKVLFIANTKVCAKNIFDRLKVLCGADARLSHLSTHMCPEHRRSVLKEVKENLSEECRMQICVSTQLIEAGVDISFRCVIRSLAGLDHVVQSAGRCNRNREQDIGSVYLIQMKQEAENVSRLKEIWMSQSAIRPVLEQYEKTPESLDNRLDSEKAIRMYFEHYFKDCANRMCYPVTVQGTKTNIVELLSDNAEFAKPKKQKQMLKQAFKTAGKCFEVIADTGKISVVVPYDASVKEALAELENPRGSLNNKKRILRKLQPYTVSISQTERERIGNGIDEVWNNRILVLQERFYDRETGVTTEPEPMPELQF